MQLSLSLSRVSEIVLICERDSVFVNNVGVLTIVWQGCIDRKNVVCVCVWWWGGGGGVIAPHPCLSITRLQVELIIIKRCMTTIIYLEFEMLISGMRQP